MSATKPELSVVLPVFNEEDSLPGLFARLLPVLEALGIPFEVVVIDDGSSDRSFALMAVAASNDPRLRVIRFSRNFGHQMALTAGLDAAAGTNVAVMDADLQDPPEILPEMLAKINEGFEVVYAQRRKREGESAFKKATAHVFYRVLRRWTNIDIPVDTGDFRILGPKALKAFRGLRERHRFVRGLTAWIGFRQTAVTYERPGRQFGETKYPFRKMLRFALDGITSFSHVPLQVATWFGFAVSILSFSYIIVVIVLKVLGINVPGWTTLMVFLLLLGGMQLVLMGVIGEYIGRIYDEIKGRPLYLVAEELNPPGDES